MAVAEAKKDTMLPSPMDFPPPVFLSPGPHSNATAEKIELPSSLLFLKSNETVLDVAQKIKHTLSLTSEQRSMAMRPLIAQLNEVLQQYPCQNMEEYQMRFVFLRNLLWSVEKHEDMEQLQATIKYHLERADLAASTMDNDSVQQSLWPLYQRILNLPSLEVDFLGWCIAKLQMEVLLAPPHLEIVQRIKTLVTSFMSPALCLRSLSGHELTTIETADDLSINHALLKSFRENLTIIRSLLESVEQAPEGYVKRFLNIFRFMVAVYHNFLEEFMQAAPSQRILLLQHKAQITGIGLGFFLLDQEIARRLISRDVRGNEVKTNTTGNHAVANIAGVFYKPNPDLCHNIHGHIHPEREFALLVLYSLLQQPGTAPTTLVKLNNVVFEGSALAHGIVLQAGFGVEGIPLGDFFGMQRALQFLTNTVGLERVVEVLTTLMPSNWNLDFLETHTALAPDALALLSSVDERARAILEEFHFFFRSKSPDKRLVGFTDTDIAESKNLRCICEVLLSNTSAQDCLVGVLALLYAIPELVAVNSKTGVRQVDLHVLMDFLYYIEKIKKVFFGLPAKEILQQLVLMGNIRLDNATAHVLAEIATNPNDHHADNLMMVFEKDVSGRISGSSIIGIDNDEMFADAFTQSASNANAHFIGIKSVIFLMEWMKLPLNSTVCQRFLSILPEEMIIHWLSILEEQNRRYLTLQQQQILTHGDLFENGEPILTIPLMLPARLIPIMLAKFKRLYAFLSSKSALPTHWELFEAGNKVLARCYQKAVEESEHPIEAYINVINGFKTVEDLLDDPNLDGIVEELSYPVQDSEFQSPAQAAICLLKRIPLANLTLVQLVRLFGMAQKSFPADASQLTLPFDINNLEICCSFFFLAVGEGYFALVARLIEEEKKISLSVKPRKNCTLINMRNDEDATALLIACSKLDLEMVDVLIHYRADPNACNAEGETAMLILTKRFSTDPEKASSLIRHISKLPHVLLNATDSQGYSILHYIVMLATEAPEQAEPLIGYLVMQGVDLELINGQNETALDMAIKLNNERVVEQLVRLGAGANLRVSDAIKFFQSRLHMQECFRLLQLTSQILRWYFIRDKFVATCSFKRKDPSNRLCWLEGVEFGRIYLCEEFSAKLFDEKGNIRNDSNYGRHRVANVALANDQHLFFKQNPEMPGIETAVYLLLKLLLGHGAPCSELVKVHHANGKSYPVLISQGIEGENLQTVLNRADSNQRLEELDRKSLFELILASMLINFEDAKPDNFIVEDLGTKTRLVGIDNDHAFVPPLARDDHTRVQVKFFCYCLEIMKEIVPKDVRERFLVWKPDRLLYQWLTLLAEHEKWYRTLFTDKERKAQFKSKKEAVVLSIPLKQGLVAEMYQKFKRMQTALRKGNITLMETLRLVIPCLGITYEESFNSYPTPQKRFHSIAHQQYSTAIAGRYGTVIGSQIILKISDIPLESVISKVETQGPLRALDELLQIQGEIDANIQTLLVIRDDLQKGNTKSFLALHLDQVREKIINGTEEMGGLNFKEMNLTVQKKVLQSMIGGNYQVLRLKNCLVLDRRSFSKLLSGSSQLYCIEIDNCSGLSESFISKLNRFTPYLTKLVLSNLPLKQLHITHSSLRHVSINRCHVLKTVDIKSPLRKFQASECSSLESFTSTSQTLVSLQLAACHKLQPWWNLFKEWLSVSTANCIELSNVPALPSRRNIPEFLKAINQHPYREDIINNLLRHCYPQIASLFEYESFEFWRSVLTSSEIIELSPEKMDIMDPSWITRIQQIFDEPNYKQLFPLLLPTSVDKLDLSCIQYTTPDELRLIANLHPEIKTVIVPPDKFDTNGNYFYSVADLSEFLTKFHHLVAVDLKLFRGSLKKVLNAMITSCPDLKEIYLQGGRATDKAIGKLDGNSTKNRPSLSSIHFLACSITYKTVNNLSYSYGHCLTSISFEACPKIDDEALKKLSTYNLLTTVNLQKCTSITEAGILALRDGCKTLNNINIDGTGVDPWAKTVPLKNSTFDVESQIGLIIEDTSRSRMLSALIDYYDVSIEQLIKYIMIKLNQKRMLLPYVLSAISPTLKENTLIIDLRCVHGLEYAELSNIVKSCPNLATLHLPFECPLLQLEWHSLFRDTSQKLTSITLPTNFGFDEVRYLTLLPSLTSIQLENNTSLSSYGLHLLAENLPKCLSQFTLKNYQYEGISLREFNLSFLFFNLRNLTSIDFSESPFILRDFKNVDYELKNLKEVYLNNCWSKNDSTDNDILMHIASCCYDLAIIGLKGFPHISSAGLKQILMNHNLRSINISNSTIGDDHLNSINCSLLSLNVAGCIGITDEGIISLATRLSTLKEINLSNCDALTKISLVYLARKCPALSHMTISMKQKIRTKDIDTLLKILPELIITNVTEEGEEIVTPTRSVNHSRRPTVMREDIDVYVPKIPSKRSKLWKQKNEDMY